MTTYIDKTKTKKTEKKTVFKKILVGSLEDNDLRIEDATFNPGNFKFVEFKGHDKYYGDIFFAWNNDENLKTIYFGEKGDEFE